MRSLAGTINLSRSTHSSSIRGSSSLLLSLSLIVILLIDQASSHLSLLSHHTSCRPIQKRQLATGAGEGGALTGPSSSPQSAGYSCDPSSCKLPNCQCASTSPPGGLNPKDVPQFIIFTADDAVQSFTINAVNQFLSQRKNPNGCQPKMTYFVSLNYTNYSMVTDWYVAGNEIADHTMTHVGDAPVSEIDGNIIALNSLSGIPISAIQGFRAPYLNYSINTMKHLKEAGFTYDSSTTSASPANSSSTDAYWPYTLDNGFANDCLSVPGLCQGQVKLPGMWEIPMYGIFDERQSAGVHLMDPWLDDPNADKVLEWMKSTFLTHYNGNRQPFGLYTHPIHLATGYPGVADPKAQIKMVNDFLDWAQQMQGVWIISNAQLLSWTKNPVPLSNLNSVSALGCSVPSVSEKICNGMVPNQLGLLQNCPFTDFPFTTCYGCPATPPSPSNPLPTQAAPSGSGANKQLRHRLPANCSTPFWDPIGNRCLCTSSSCQFQDETRPIGPNGANLTGGGVGGSTSGNGNMYTPFKAAGSQLLACSSTWKLVTLLSFVGSMMLYQY
ncbi:family 4 carbohydrate esterase [Phakopsora pachyrhizi]|uniref:Family 4 carbohydrate esterase n=1 Tax=Phakopsora pachyrhizi TaxID=170000 RepID=A0AAV0BJB8_PHAPC|nr:family 4 carbohydrate esterase [Phakopsora pachyrhizi]CAH7686651.1 family 4 carbohydrate esterase [Phakopsora pachyrhizi]